MQIKEEVEFSGFAVPAARPPPSPSMDGTVASSREKQTKSHKRRRTENAAESMPPPQVESYPDKLYLPVFFRLHQVSRPFRAAQQKGSLGHFRRNL